VTESLYAICEGKYMTESPNPKAFISYSWDNEDHKKWVKALAARLRSDGINVILDRWSVNPGGQLPEFMERAVRDNDYVLIVCTPNYKDKSNNRAGGVGYEGDIMTAEVLVYGNDEKFIPLQRLGEWETCAPSWLLGKYRIDFRGEPYSEDTYTELLEFLFGRREKAPQLGKPKALTQASQSLVVRSSKEDKDFALWLSLQLINEGYAVWSDLLNPEPGEFTEAMIEESIRNKAFKYLFVLSNTSNADSGILKELRFAYEMMQNKRLAGFVVPLQVSEIDEKDLNILLQGTSPIDFSLGWSKGIHDLLGYLEQNNTPKDLEFTPSRTTDIWRLQNDPNKGVTSESEELISNWFPITLPEFIYIHQLQRSPLDTSPIREESLPFPALLRGNFLFSFANSNDFVDKLGASLSITSTKEVAVKEFLDGNYDQSSSQDLSWNVIVELLNMAWGNFFSTTKLAKYIMANNRECFYFLNRFSEKSDNKSYFMSMDGRRSYRYLVGKHKSSFWHFGIQGKAVLYPEPVFVVKSHVLFSNDGMTIWPSKDRLHTARRSWCKNWWNAEWRDRLMASLAFLATSENQIDLSAGTGVYLGVSTLPSVFASPVSYLSSRDLENLQNEDVEELIDEDDTVDEYIELDDEI